MEGQSKSEESNLDRVASLIAELDREEFLLTGLDPSPSAVPSAEIELALAALRDRRKELEEELAEVWAEHCSRC